MQITFDPLDQAEVGLVMNLMSIFDPDAMPATVAVDAPPETTGNVVPMPTPAPTVTPPEEDPRVGVELDNRGVPWLEDAHATTKSKTAAGNWTKKRGVDAATVKALEDAAIGELNGTPAPIVPETEDLPALTAPPATIEDLSNAYEAALGADVLGDGSDPDKPSIRSIYHEFLGHDDISQISVDETARAGVVQRLNELISLATNIAPGVPGI